ncbi:MAG: co-chaperone GroES [Erysipelotrichia bacterium]|nr:co-chaperone GroES [Erysipelotrichia bacterium]
MLKPLHDYVVLEKCKEEVKTQSGIILTGKPKDEPSNGIVVAVGPGKVEDGKLIPIELKKGQQVIYKKYSGTDITVDKKDLLLIQSDDILAVVEK